MSNDAFKVLLSQPRGTESDIDAVVKAIRSGWLAPAGPELSAFEEDVATHVGVNEAVALSSGTAALHLALKYLGVKPGDAVLVPTLTFAATANAVSYLGADPVFIDVTTDLNLSAEQADRAISELTRVGKRIGAVVPVDLYGSCADYSLLEPLFESHSIPLLEDAAEALGAVSGGRQAGSFGQAGVFSFNGNKIITSSGGGMLVSDDHEMISKVRYWSTQAREALPWYEHLEVGYNYRLSNILAALGRSQFKRLNEEISLRRSINDVYRERLDGLNGITIKKDRGYTRSNAWLTIAEFASAGDVDTATLVRERLGSIGVESRPIWKPMHLQPVFSRFLFFGDGTAEKVFRGGLCLPSGGGIEIPVVHQICDVIIDATRHAG